MFWESEEVCKVCVCGEEKDRNIGSRRDGIAGETRSIKEST